MSDRSTATLGGLLARLRRRGEPLSAVDLAQRLLALRAPVDPALARSIVAAALGRPGASVPDRLDASSLRPAAEAAVAGVRLEAADFAVFDLETTGLSVDDSAIVEIGAVRVSRLRRADRFATLVRPPGRVPRAITALTGIDDRMLADAPPARRALRDFRRWLDRAAALVAHNAQFDARFVSRALEDCALPPHRAPVLCTRRLARRLLPRLGRYDLDHLCAHFGIANRARHRALGDAEATAAALIDLVQLARAESGARTVGDLLDIQERPPPKPRRRPTR